MVTDTNSSRRNPSPNPTPAEAPMVAFRFLRTLSVIQQAVPKSSHASRCRRIRRAAYASMAYSAGPRRAWSRALLRKLRSRSRPRSSAPGIRRPRAVVIPRRIRVARPRASGPNRSESTLRQLVPGGEGMDYCNLLEETADYIRCLSMQVMLMRSIVDSIPS